MDTLHVFSKEKKELTKLYIDIQDSTRNNIIPDTSCFISQYQNDNVLFISIMINGENGIYGQLTLFFGLFDINSNKWILKHKTIEDALEVKYRGSSSDLKYHLFEYGLSNDGGLFEIFDNHNNIIKKGQFNNTEDKNILKWQSQNKFYYYLKCNYDSLPNNLPSLDKPGQIYVQKLFWINGKDSITNDFLKSYEE
jgi:hypothetical protein